jgi:iron(III) transport system ATP-binding protein
VALARALAPRPPLVLLDEPVSGLDAALRAETRDAVLQALAAQGTTAVLVTHDQAEALSMGREVGVLRSGCLVQTAAPSVLYRTPVDLDTARFVGGAVVLAGDAAGGVVATALGELALIDQRVHGRVDVMIRPEQIELHAAGSPSWPDARAAAAKTIGATFYGPDTVVALELEGQATPITARVLGGREAPAPGTTVWLTVSGPVMAYVADAAPSSEAADGERVGGRA